MSDTLTELAEMLNRPYPRKNGFLVILKAREGYSAVWMPTKVYGKIVGLPHHNAETITGAIQKAMEATNEQS